MALCLSAAAADLDAAWHKYPVFADRIDDIVQIDDKVYYLSDGSLFSFCETDQESYAYSSLNTLSDNTISSIHFNPYAGFLLVVYDNSNMDAVFNDGTVVNLPDIYNSQMAVKGINHVAFSPTRFVLSTDFGIVVYSNERLEVIESGNFGQSVTASAIFGDWLAICSRGVKNAGHHLYLSPVGVRHNDLSKFTEMVSQCAVYDIVPTSDSTFVARNFSNTLFLAEIDFDNAAFKNPVYAPNTVTSPIRRTKEGSLFATNATGIVTYDGGALSEQTLPQALQGQKIAMWDSPERVWAGDNDGIAKYDISAATPTVLYQKMLHGGSTTVKNVGYMRFSPDNKRLYVSSIGASNYRTAAPLERSLYQATNIIDLSTGAITDASALNVTAEHPAIVKIREEKGSTRMWGDANWIQEDPDDPSIYYCANNHEGVYVLKRDDATGRYEQIGKFDLNNAPFIDFWGARVDDVTIDPAGNLWVGYRGQESDPSYSILPAAKRRADPATIKKTDWKTITALRNLGVGSLDMKSLFHAPTGCAFLSSNNHRLGITVVNTGGHWDNAPAFSAKQYGDFTDQDGNNFNFSVASYLIQDSRGAIWVGTTTGVFEITNPAQFASGANTTVRRLKVPRNDGTNFADYLLDSDQINWIANDPAGRKWIATDASGIFLVSAAGDKIIRTYNTSNSPLPSNTVNCIECDPETNTVYVGTPYGLYSFLSDASAPSEDMSSILAYPNPVRPDYDGPVTITGLMENSVVKIADTAGNVVFQTKSEGGMASWPCTNAAGKPVKSGVYYIIANSHNDSASKGATSKVTVIR